MIFLGKEGIIIGAIIGIAISIFLGIIMANIFGTFEQIPQSNESREQLEKIEDTWKITDIISTLGALLIICLGVIFFLYSLKR